MTRKLLMLASIAGMLATLALGVINEALRWSCHAPVRMQPCPVRFYLGRASNGSYRFIYSASYSWYSTVGYARLKGTLEGGGDFADESGLIAAEEWFHALCWSPIANPGNATLNFVRLHNDVLLNSVYLSHLFQRAIIIPRGTFFAIFALYPTIALVRGPLRRWRRNCAGACLRCGYDLTGNVTGVCPECGIPHDTSTHASRPPAEPQA